MQGAIVHIGWRSGARMRLVCVPYAGAGAAAYRDLPGLLPPWVQVSAVRLPGRESRITETPLADIGEVVTEVLDWFDPAGAPYALFGHSMGGLVCFEVARKAALLGLPEPLALFVSGRRAPHVPDPDRALHLLPEKEFLSAVRALNGIPAEVVGEPGLLELIAPALRGDFAVCENYRHSGQQVLSCPISVFGGHSDPTTTVPALQGWREHTTGPFRLRLYAGDHFFLHANQRDIAASITEDLEEVMSACEPPAASLLSPKATAGGKEAVA